jgi:hypothetical protein
MKRKTGIFIFLVTGAALCSAQSPKAIFYQSLAWSSDGKYLAFTAMSDYDAKSGGYRRGVFIINAADGSKITRLAN